MEWQYAIPLNCPNTIEYCLKSMRGSTALILGKACTGAILNPRVRYMSYFAPKPVIRISPVLKAMNRSKESDKCLM